MRMVPTGDRVLCRALPRETMTSGGILIPSAQNGREDRAEVLAVGPGRRLKSGTNAPMEVHAGDVVMFDPYQVDAVLGEAQAATPHAKAGSLFLIRERHLLAVVDQ